MKDEQTRTPKQARSRETETALLASLDELLSRKSYPEVTVAEIATEAGVTTGAIYRRFKNKRSLLIAAVTRGIEQFQTLASVNQGGYAPELADHQLVMNLVQDLFGIMFDNFRILKAAAFIRDEQSYEKILAARHSTAGWFAETLQSSSYSGDTLKRKVVFVLRMATAVYLDTLLPIAETTVTREQYLSNNRQQMDRLFLEIHQMSCRYLGLPDQHN
ncbi:MAG: TetR/AcrR family transcriptional regulator [Pseudomonadota bacterium]